MIATLFANELRVTRRTLLPTLGIMLAVIALGLAGAALQLPVLGSLGFGAAVAAILAITPVVLAVLTAHYWRTMYGAQGYFTMTIPVRGRTLYAAKVLYGVAAGLAALLLSAALALVAVMAFALTSGVAPLELLREFAAQVDFRLFWAIAAALVLTLVFTVIAGATAMSVGAEARFNRLGFGAPVLFVVALYFVMQVLNLAGLLFIPLGVRITGPDAGAIVPEGMMSQFVRAIRNPEFQPDVLGLGVIVVVVVVGALLAWWGARSVDRRTSLR